MNLGNLSYLSTVIIFPGLALMLYLLVRIVYPATKSKLFLDEWWVIAQVIFITGVFTGPAEWAALNWRAWAYNSQKTLHLRLFGAEIETFLFTILVSLVVAIATIIYARHEERNMKPKNKS